MKNPFRRTKTKPSARARRVLAFEQVEDRLALSTTSGVEFSTPELMTLHQGGFVNLSVSDADYDSVQIVDLNASFALNIISRDSHESAVSADVGNKAGFNGITREYSMVPNSIPQPVVKNPEPSGGIIAINEIFAPSLARPMNEPSQHVAETAKTKITPQIALTKLPTTEINLARGRDVYFDVASLSDQRRDAHHDESSEEGSLVSTGMTQTTERASRNGTTATTAAVYARRANLDHATRGNRDNPTYKSRFSSEPVQPISEAVPAVSESVPNESRQDGSSESKKVSATDHVTDEVFATWQEHESLLIGNRGTLRQEDADDKSATWPVLAALAVGGLVVRSRRPTKGTACQQQPPRRKKFGSF